MVFFLYVVAVVATVALGGVWVIGAVANYTYGSTQGTMDWQSIAFPFLTLNYQSAVVMAWTNVGVDVLKWALPFSVAAAWRWGLRGWSAILGALFGVALYWSFTNAMGYMATERANAVDGRAQAGEQYSALNTRLQNLINERGYIVTGFRPTATVEADIAGMTEDPVFTRAKACRDITLPESAAHCRKLSMARVELGNARAARDLDDKIEEVRTQLKGEKRRSSADPYLDMMVAWFGWSRENQERNRALNYALMIEGLTAFAPAGIWYAVFAAQEGIRRRRRQEALEAEAARRHNVFFSDGPKSGRANDDEAPAIGQGSGQNEAPAEISEPVAEVETPKVEIEAPKPFRPSAPVLVEQPQQAGAEDLPVLRAAPALPAMQAPVAKAEGIGPLALAADIEAALSRPLVIPTQDMQGKRRKTVSPEQGVRIFRDQLKAGSYLHSKLDPVYRSFCKDSNIKPVHNFGTLLRGLRGVKRLKDENGKVFYLVVDAVEAAAADRQRKAA